MIFPTLILLAVGAAPEPSSRLAVIRPAPDFALTTQDGDTLRLSDLKGRVLLVSFVFTTCNGTCPATTLRMAQVQQALDKRGLTRDGRARLLSITLDPARDTPEVLRRYLKLYEADPASWTFLTGDRERVEKVVTAWGMWAKALPGGQLDHPSRVFLVDTRGRVREIYNLDYLRPAWVAEDVEALLGEGRGK